jgi:hypothetical protein
VIRAAHREADAPVAVVRSGARAGGSGQGTDPGQVTELVPEPETDQDLDTDQGTEMGHCAFLKPHCGPHRISMRGVCGPHPLRIQLHASSST